MARCRSASAIAGAMATVTASVISSCTAKNVGKVPIVPLRPDVVAGLALDQLTGDPDAVAGLAETALQHISNAELAPNLLYVDGAAFVGERGIAGDHEQRGIARQRGDDVLGDPIGDEFLLGVVLILVKGNTATDGLSGSGGAVGSQVKQPR